MREQEIARDNFEKGKLEGIAEGVINKGRQEATAKGIEKIIEIYREELNFEDEIIVQKLIKKYDLTREEAEKYLG